MHLAEGILPLPHALAWSAAGAVAVLAGSAAWRWRQDRDAGAPLAFASMSTALVFAVTLFPVPVPVIALSSHLCATPVLSLCLGARIVPSVAAVLLVQALFFAHGGITTLGANVVTLGVVAPVVATALARAALRASVPHAYAVGLACGLAHLAVYATDAVILAAGFAGARPFTHWLLVIVVALAPVQLVLGLVEAVASVFLIRALAARRPELLPDWLRPRPARVRGGVVALLGAVLLGVALSVLAPAPALAFPGVDESVFEAAGEAAGQTPASILDLESGETWTALIAGSFFAAGFVVGRFWAAPAPGRSSS